MKVVVFGGRDYKDHLKVFHKLEQLHMARPITFLIEGGANGVDLFARNWRAARKVPGKTYVAEWDNIDRPGAVIREHPDGREYDAAAGGARNQKMVDSKPDLAVKFPGGRGTADMLARVRKAGIELIEVD